MGFWILNFSPKPLTGTDFRIIIGKSGTWREAIPGSATSYHPLKPAKSAGFVFAQKVC
jgi:hypothetical protein